MASIEELFASMYESFDRRQGLMVECLRLMEKMTTPPSPEMKEEDSTVTTTEETLDDVPEAQLHPVAVPCAQIHHNAKGLLSGTTTTGFSVGESKLGYTVAAPPQIHFIGNHNPQLQRDFTWMQALGVSFNVLAIDTSPSVAADRNSLNTLAIDTGRRWKDPWRWFDESMPDCCEPLDKVKAQTCPYICSATAPTNCSTELLKDVAAFHPVYMITEDFVFDPGITADVYWGKYRTILAFAALYPYRPVRARRSVTAVTLQKDGNMVLTDYDGTVVWQADGNFTKVQHAQLLNTGNLVIKDSSGSTVWQSFDSPTDTFLPTQHITATVKLVPTTQSHNPGTYIFRFSDLAVLSLIYDVPLASDIYWPNPDQTLYQDGRNQYNSTRLGFLDNSGMLVSSDFANGQPLVASDAGKNITRRLTLDPDGNLRMYSWNESNRSWSVSMQAMSQLCNIHGLCGPNGICHYSPKPTCSCPPGYVMRNKGNWTEGCASIVNITCDHYDQETMKFVKLPDTDFWGSDQQHLLTKSLKDCRNICISDCTCKGFQYQEGTGSCYPKAYLFSGRTYPTSDVRTIYIKLSKRVNESNFPIPHSGVFDSSPNHLECDQMSKNIRQPFPDVHSTGGGEAKWFYFYGFIAALFVVEVLFISFAWFFVLRRENWPSEIWAAEEGYKIMSSNFRRYSYRELVMATRKFKVELGRGGSGTVYKGVLEDDRPVAVKKLENVKQGKEEFQSELSIIGRINHMNLVRIWGFCSEGSHRLLVSEYVENGSLASILFNGKNYTLLDWKGRFNISLGVARGLAYLHHECLEWVIHCDVKPENILLDQKFEPKITDFGLAKLLSRGGPNQNVSHVRGTLGYIAPEWASGLPITAKVDVYSYGVVLLELLSGTRVSELVDGSDEVHMVRSKLVRTLADKSEWEEQSWIDDFVDPKLSRPLNYVQARTLIRLAISCLDEDRDKRPTMESIVQTLLSVDD